MPADLTVLELERGYRHLVDADFVGEAELNALGRLARSVAAQRVGPHRVVAYVLSHVFFDFASRADGASTIDFGNAVLAAANQPILKIVQALNDPLSDGRAIALAERLLDSRDRALDQLD